MELFFLRHGIAEDAAASDFDRRLTDEGRAKCRDAAPGIQAVAGQLDAVWSSPLVRARETAELVADGHPIKLREELANAPLEQLFDALRKQPGDARVLLVGHEPQLSAAIEQLLGAHDGLVEMKKAGLAHLTVDLRRWPGQPAVLHCLLTPKQVRQMGR
jgi:phosphohistidine phosphatase